MRKNTCTSRKLQHLVVKIHIALISVLLMDMSRAFFVTVSSSHKKYFSKLLKVNCMSVSMQITLSMDHVSAETAFQVDMPL